MVLIIRRSLKSSFRKGFYRSSVDSFISFFLLQCLKIKVVGVSLRVWDSIRTFNETTYQPSHCSSVMLQGMFSVCSRLKVFLPPIHFNHMGKTMKRKRRTWVYGIRSYEGNGSVLIRMILKFVWKRSKFGYSLEHLNSRWNWL